MVAAPRGQPIQGIPRLSKPIQAILGKKRLFIFFPAQGHARQGGRPQGPSFVNRKFLSVVANLINPASPDKLLG
jgi:hypothetical protein